LQTYWTKYDSEEQFSIGNRMYLELLRNNFTGTGVIAEVMGKM